MKKSTLKAGCLAVFAMISGLASAESMAITEFYGKYKFQANVELTAEGQGLADYFTTGTEVVIEADQFYLAQISCYANGEEIHYVNKQKDDTLKVYNPNGTSYYYWTTKNLSMADINGTYPHGGAFEMYYVYDQATGDLKMPDFTAVSCGTPDDPVTVMAKFTNCRLELVEKAVIEFPDLSGEYTFNGSYYDEESELPHSFGLTLTALNDEFKLYKAVIAFEGFQEATIDSATFDGALLSLPLNNHCIDEEAPYYLMSWSPRSLTAPITFNIAGEGRLSLYSGMGIATKDSVEGELKNVVKMWIMSGVAKLNNMVEVSYAGTYTVTCAGDPIVNIEGVTFPKEFTLVIEQDPMGDYFVTEFMGYDTYSMNYGGLYCICEDNIVSIELMEGYSNLAMVDLAEDFSWGQYYTLLNATAESGYLYLTLNGDGTGTLTNFAIANRKVSFNDGSILSFDVIAYYTDMTVTGLASLLNDEGEIKVYNINGAYVGNSLDNQPKGLYIVKQGASVVKILK